MCRISSDRDLRCGSAKKMPEGLEKGQTSFEMIIVTTIVMAIVVTSMALVPGIVSSTGKIAVLKNELLLRFSEQKEFSYILDIKEPKIGISPQEITVLYGGKELAPATESQWESELAQELVDKKFYSDASQVKINLAHQ